MSALNKSEASTWQAIVVAYTIKIVLVIIILSIGFWLINKLTTFTNALLRKRHVDGTINSFFKTLAGTGLKILLVVFVLNFIGVTTTSLVAIVGAAGLAIGLALQGTLTNFASGVMLLLFKPFRVGDTIEVQGKKGVVKEVQIFSTLLITADNKIIIFPNNLLSNGIIENSGKVKPENTPTQDAAHTA